MAPAAVSFAQLPGDLSRNRTVGLRLGRGEALAAITASMHGAVAEGVLTSRSAYNLSRRLGVEVPIIEGIWRVIHGAWTRRGFKYVVWDSQ
jgi:glycerol-3-phosphate dehydrogenase